jgi:hypothetical protein
VAYMIGLLVDEYGYLTGGEDVFPVDTIDHDWETPYPRYDGVAEFTWEAGELGEQPGVFRHPEIRDWACDEQGWSVLQRTSPGDFHLIGEGRLDGRRLLVLQVVTILDIVDREASIIDGTRRTRSCGSPRSSVRAGTRSPVGRSECPARTPTCSWARQ